jgi:RNA polymerase sigma-70 factor (ECF subfamily)
MQRYVAAMAKSSDQDTSLTLVMRVQKDRNDARAWDEFVHKYQPIIRAWCLKWGAQASDADDVAQQVLIKLLSAMKKYQCEPGTSFRRWLRSVTHHAWIDFVRRPRAGQASRWLESVADSFDAVVDLEQQMEDAYEREVLELAMRRVEPRVKPHTWEAFRLTSIDNLPGSEAARRLGMPVSHVFVHKHRVMKLLEEEVKDIRGEEE